MALKKLPAYLTLDEFMKLIKVVTVPHHKLAFILGFHSGMRVGEIVHLQKENIDLNGRRIFIKDAKGGKDRVVPLPKGFPQSYLKLIPIRCGIRALQYAFTKAVKKAGIIKTGLSIHSCRHSFAVHCMEKGIPLNQVQVLLGHENISTTNIYTKINPKDALDNYEKMW
jgi:integrase